MRRALRQVIAALVALYTVYFSAGALGQVIARSGFYDFAGWRRTPQPWLDNLTDWQMGLALLVSALFAACVMGIATGARTFLVYVGTVALNLILFAFIRLDGVYQAYAPAQQQRIDAVMGVGLLLAGAVLWWTERGPARKSVPLRS